MPSFLSSRGAKRRGDLVFESLVNTKKASYIGLKTRNRHAIQENEARDDGLEVVLSFVVIPECIYQESKVFKDKNI